ncbi:right-handed parallel beta-helix repeat-containing protein, partial [Rhodocytophaga aerolata]
AFEGFNFRTFDVERTTDVTVANCNITFSGGDAIGGSYTTNLTVENSVIEGALNNGIGLIWQCPGAIIRNNQVKNVGYIAGMGGSNNFTYQAIMAIGHNALIENNSIINNGYVPLSFRGNNSIVRKNYVENFCYIKDDGGAIHTWNNMADAAELSNQKVTDNIILKGTGAPEGTANPDLYLVKGIYMDDNTANVEIARNTVSKCTNGIYVHNSHNLNIHSNTFFDNRDYQVKYEHDKVAPDKPIRNVVFKNNVLVANTPDQGLMNLITKDNDISQFGTFESNYYTRAIKGSVDAVTTISGRYTSSQVITTYNLPKWKTVFGFESGSVENTPVPHYKVNQLIGSNKYPNKSFDSNINGIMKLSASGNLRADWDNTNKLSGGSLRMSFAQVADQKAIGQAAAVVGNIDESKKYLLKFSFISANTDRTVKVILMNNTSPYQTIERKSFKSSGKRIEHEFLIEPSSSLAQASLRFEIAETDGTVWIDNIELYEADVAIDPEHVRLEYNTGNTSKTISFNGITYINGRGESKSGNLNLESFASEVLIKQSGELNIVSPLEIKIGSKPILCYGQSSGSAVVSATGGVPPYR